MVIFLLVYCTQVSARIKDRPNEETAYDTLPSKQIDDGGSHSPRDATFNSVKLLVDFGSEIGFDPTDQNLSAPKGEV